MGVGVGVQGAAFYSFRFVLFISFPFAPGGVSRGSWSWWRAWCCEKGKKKRELPGGLDWFSLEGGTRVPATVVDFLDTVGFLISDVG